MSSILLRYAICNGVSWSLSRALTSAPPSPNIPTSSSLSSTCHGHSDNICNGVWPRIFAALAFAPWIISTRPIASFPWLHARCSGVSLLLSWAFTSAPFSSNRRTIRIPSRPLRFPSDTRCSAVCPSSPFVFDSCTMGEQHPYDVWPPIVGC